MQAIQFDTPGDNDVLKLVNTPEPEIGAGEVLIRTAAAGINRADILQRQGNYPPPKGASSILGLEASGTIEAVGSDVTGWKIGDRVCALLSGGGYAEKIAVPAGQLLPVPGEFDLVSAAALPEAICTVWSNIVMQGRLARDETLLIHGGGSGIGTCAIQIAKHLGARVACTAGSAEKLAVAERLGADILINYKEEDFSERMKELGGADLILDIIGAKYLKANLSVLNADGRLVIIGLQGGVKSEINLGLLLAKRLRIIGTTLRALSTERKSMIVEQVREHVWPLIRNGTYRPVIDRVLPLGCAGEAHALIEKGAVTGKVLLTP